MNRAAIILLVGNLLSFVLTESAAIDHAPSKIDSDEEQAKTKAKKWIVKVLDKNISKDTPDAEAAATKSKQDKKGIQDSKDEEDEQESKPGLKQDLSKIKSTAIELAQLILEKKPLKGKFADIASTVKSKLASAVSAVKAEISKWAKLDEQNEQTGFKLNIQKLKSKAEQLAQVALKDSSLKKKLLEAASTVKSLVEDYSSFLQSKLSGFLTLFKSKKAQGGHEDQKDGDVDQKEESKLEFELDIAKIKSKAKELVQLIMKEGPLKEKFSEAVSLVKSKFANVASATKTTLPKMSAVISQLQSKLGKLTESDAALDDDDDASYDDEDEDDEEDDDDPDGA